MKDGTTEGGRRNVRHALLAASLAALLVLGGCATTPVETPAPPAGPRVEAPPQPRAETPKPAPTTRGGAFYLDDGPGDNPPANLDALPDAEPRPEPLHRFANNPYVVFGQQYVPVREVRPFRQRGVASWYGRRFHGQKTSSGEVYDMYAMTAAHPTLPIPSYARVTSVATGRSVVVRINDRGPFLHNRVVDLSYAAAYRLGYVQQGSTMVELEAVVPGFAPPPTQVAAVTTDVPARQDPPAAPPAPPVPVAAEPGGIFIQLGAFSAAENAEASRQRIAAQLGWLDKAVEVYRREGLFRLHVGPYRDRAEARRVADRIGAALDVKPSVVVR
jgi:rare lipoprotein A